MSSHLNYCNSLLSDIADTDLAKLQHVHNRLARIVIKSPQFTHSVPLLHSHHWLPVKFRIVFKVRLLSYKTLHERQSVYLHSIFAPSRPSPLLRSNKGITLFVPRVKIKAGARAFHSCVPSLWNNLSLSLQPLQLQPSGDVSRLTSLTWPFANRHQQANYLFYASLLYGVSILKVGEAVDFSGENNGFQPSGRRTWMN